MKGNKEYMVACLGWFDEFLLYHIYVKMQILTSAFVKLHSHSYYFFFLLCNNVHVSTKLLDTCNMFFYMTEGDVF